MLPSIFSGQANSDNTAVLALADGTTFKGVSVGANGVCTAELVFNTLLTGHQEAITDPAYSKQILAFTYPHIGNTGVNTEDCESNKAQVSGLVMRDCSLVVSNYRSTQSLPDYLKQQGVVAISGIDTRKLTNILRESGKQAACIMVGENAEQAVALAQQYGSELKANTTDSAECLNYSSDSPNLESQGAWHIVVYDYGVKSTALTMLANKGCKVSVVAPNTPVSAVLKLKPDGVFLSSGPGNPNNCQQYVSILRELSEQKLPILAVGLGMQLLAISQGATVSELKTGNHGANHPVRSLTSGKVYIASLKQGFAVSTTGLSNNIRPTYTSLFDGSLQGFELNNAPALAIQAYPEASPGPSDLVHVIDQFISLLDANK